METNHGCGAVLHHCCAAGCRFEKDDRAVGAGRKPLGEPVHAGADRRRTFL